MIFAEVRALVAALPTVLSNTVRCSRNTFHNARQGRFPPFGGYLGTYPRR